MAPTLEAFLGGPLQLGSAQVAGPLAVAPIFGPSCTFELVGLEQALSLGAVAKELPQPEVGRIEVENPTPHPLLLLDGEEIIGAQQNRIIDGTVVVPARSRRTVAVCCVEQGRWEHAMREEAFRTSPQVAPASLRSVKSRTGRQRGVGDQGAVWTEVRSHVEATRTVTMTGAITDVFDARRGSLEALVARFEVVPEQRGMVVAVGSRIWAVDYVADAAAFARLHARLLRGYVLDAMRLGAKHPRVAREELEQALARLARRPLAREVDEERYRFGGEGLPVEGMATLFEGRLVAVSALLPGAPLGGGMKHPVRTSETSPIEVSWLDETVGALGITFAPGKRARSSFGAPWVRDLELDLLRLRRLHRVDTLVCLLEDHELERLGMAGYEERARAHGIELLRMPVVDGCVPSSPRATSELVEAVRERLGRGARVVVHCRGGLGRAGTLAGCVLVASGRYDGAGALDLLARRRSPHCLETAAQRAFVERFAARLACA